MQKYIENLKYKNIHIVGAFGAEGSAVLEFMARNGAKNITAHDFSADIGELRKNFSKTHLWLKKTERLEAFEKLFKIPAKINLKNNYLQGIFKADMIFAPSSWRLYKSNFPLLCEAEKKRIPFSSLTKLYFDLAKGKIISVTGTKGKGTTARLIYEILRFSASRRITQDKFFPQSKSRRNIYLAGNDRRSAQELEKISKMKKGDILVLETSNRQLMDDLGRSPDIGIITNISPDHIDEHESFEKYIEAKKSLFRHSKKGDIAVLNYDNAITKKIGEELAEQGLNVFFFSRKSKLKKGAFVENGKIYALGNQVSKLEICDLADIKIIGEHNIENVLAAALAAHLAGATPEEIKSAVSKFSGLPRRLEFIGEYNGVKFYDDTASTNPESTIAAIKTLFNTKYQIPNTKYFLIVGGDDKGMDYSELARIILKKVDTLILLPGTGSENVKCQMSNVKQINSIIKERDNFSEALNLIKAQTKTGDTVLISPACAHFQARYIGILKKPLRNLIVEKFK
ncbi:UDP-N-acetylmuramoyl-L-alanine--D-glutamate ligase [Patescibacteria group bacterium]|nr:UDP-N-acetylmuramoyl-L-alanine--D-glutamate ligase [Patescibacteria group bacterium]MBU4000421.1 UDP-N-acetylmuramoyl-L-alanine--D-glutamate ligase [Patescibacteria group bacterium]MBU4056388.1 UDP-N-acetylmuramoyl-L-alanine--D-glutamate ligase [Patescibacteria group bacterium]MBU4368197.1 UDP-N-acetylmuramoyl-L-alanine--D-glutamate ligase [Patescibacteria group bacterium]